MAVIRLLPVVLSALLLAAHFFRMESPVLVVLALVIPFVLFIKRPWAARLVQVALVVGAMEWIRTLVMLVARRQEEGEPWTRLAIILAVVALFTASSALPFSVSRSVRRTFGLEKPQDG